ncbi:MAG: prephenate dehydrogenase [Candidatus Marinimicrobia bacterium]|nr:prephenate dehydrogenase [Candidatus Neomarinimicrobiota bacterium]
MYKTISIIGTGLIGGSLALLIKKVLPNIKLIAVDLPSVIQNLPEHSPFDDLFEANDISGALKDSDLIFLGLPISGIINIIPKVMSDSKDGAVICDLGSVNAAILKEAEKNSVPGKYFLSGHPIGGSEGHGFSDASADHLDGVKFMLSPASNVPEEVIKKHSDFLTDLNFEVSVMDSVIHDRIIAYTSHLPQFISTALTLSVGQIDKSEQTTGRGMYTMTRLASSPPEIWNDIIRFNNKEIREAISVFSTFLSEIEKDILDGSISEKFNSAAELKKKIRGES